MMKIFEFFLLEIIKITSFVLAVVTYIVCVCVHGHWKKYTKGHFFDFFLKSNCLNAKKVKIKLNKIIEYHIYKIYSRVVLIEKES